jgi:hypothetical protein
MSRALPVNVVIERPGVRAVFKVASREDGCAGDRGRARSPAQHLPGPGVLVVHGCGPWLGPGLRPRKRRRVKTPRSKLDYVEHAAEFLVRARRELIDSSADFGTPEEIEDASVLVRLALDRVNQLLLAHGRRPRT